MARMRERLDVPVMCGVGAAFDFHAGRISQAPALDAGARASSGSTGSLRSRAGCWPRYLRYNPRFVLGVRAPVPGRAPQRASLDCAAWTSDVAVIGLGRVGLPLALSFADRGLDVIGVERRPGACCDQLARRPDAVPGARHPGAARARARGRPARAARARRRRRAGATTSCSRSARRRYSHIEIDISRHPRACSTTCCRCCARATRSSCARRSRPGTTEFVAGYLEQQRGFRVGEDLFVAHVPERIAENHFIEEIATLPCIVGGVGEALGRPGRPSCSRRSARAIVQTTPVQAELAKIWTNILRYAQFALPNLLMMECEQYGANVFEVIDLINRDYPRGGIAAPGLDRRHLPAQGLHLLRGALERARACCSPSRA